MPSPLTTLAFLVVASLGLVAAEAARAGPKDDADAAIKRLLEWVVSEGGRLKMTVGLNANGIRGVIATEDIAAQTPTMWIPRHLVLSIPVKDMVAVDMAPYLIKEFQTNCSKLRPYLDIMPSPAEVVTGYNFPSEYLPYVNSPSLADQLGVFMSNIAGTLRGERDHELPLSLPEAMGTNEEVQLEYLSYTTALVASRTIQYRDAALSMIPVADLVNHKGGQPGDCYFGENNGFVTVTCYADKKKGDEITITYGNMRCDTTFLYYGFVDATEDPPKLANIDHHQYSSATLDQKFSMELFDGSVAEMKEEIERLKALLASFDKGLKEQGPIPHIAGLESFKFALESLLGARRKGMVYEIERLQTVVQYHPEL